MTSDNRPELERLRHAIDGVDERLVRLLAERAATASSIGEEKRRLGIRVSDQDRETAVLERVTSMNPGPMSNQDLSRIYEAIIAACSRVQETDA